MLWTYNINIAVYNNRHSKRGENFESLLRIQQ